MKTIKIKQIKNFASFNKKNYLYALGENGKLYFILHDPKSNTSSWKEIPASEKIIN